MKKACGVLLSLLLLVCLAVPAFAAPTFPEPTANFFVNDFACCISPEDEAEMQALGEALYKETSAQVVVVTVDSLNGYDIREYGYKLGREWGIGSEKDDSGILLLLSSGDRKIDIEVGYGFEGEITDARTGRILDTYAIPYLRKDDFSAGLRESYKALINEAYAACGVEGYTRAEQDDEDVFEASTREKIDAVFAILLIIGIILLTLRRGGRGRRGGFFFFPGGGSGFSGGGFSGGSGGGGFSGGSGGSGGGFSGGGGSFGGGGSSRGF